MHILCVCVFFFLYTLQLKARGARKVTGGITGLWQPSVHSDVAF